MAKCLLSSSSSPASYESLLRLSSVPGALRMYYLVLSITVTSSTTSPPSIVRKALTLLIDIGLGGSNNTTTTKKKATSTTTTTITDANIMIAIENLNKLSMALTSNLNSKILGSSGSNDGSSSRNTTDGIRISVDVCHYDDTDDAFYATRYNITLLKIIISPTFIIIIVLSLSQFICMAGSFR